MTASLLSLTLTFLGSLVLQQNFLKSYKGCQFFQLKLCHSSYFTFSVHRLAVKPVIINECCRENLNENSRFYILALILSAKKNVQLLVAQKDQTRQLNCTVSLCLEKFKPSAVGLGLFPFLAIIFSGTHLFSLLYLFCTLAYH